MAINFPLAATDYDYEDIEYCKVYNFPSITSEKKKTKTGGCTLGGANAIRDDEVVLNMMGYFFNHNNGTSRKSFGIRNYAIVCFGFNTALRGSDLLSLKLSDVINPDTGEIVKKFMIREGKTRKPRVVFINSVMRKALEVYLKSDRPMYMEDLDQPIFQSRQVDTDGNPKHISLRRYNQLLKEVQTHLDIAGKISTHSGRKTFARGMYDSAPDNEKQHILMLISAILNHADLKTTRIYLDIQEDEIEAMVYARQLGLDL